MVETILAIGAHIGDMDLSAGPYLAQNVLDGGVSVLLALTPGERGHPTMAVADYRRQKIAEGEQFAHAIGGELKIFDDLSDGLLQPTEQIAARTATVIRQLRPTMVLSHWPQSIHPDHEHAAWIAQRARFLAALPSWTPEGRTTGTAGRTDTVATECAGERHSVAQLLYTENWEDAAGYCYDTVAIVGDPAYSRWRAAIDGAAFARGETYGFRYIDYYDAQMKLRGCLHRTSRAIGLRRENRLFTTIGPSGPTDRSATV